MLLAFLVQYQHPTVTPGLAYASEHEALPAEGGGTDELRGQFRPRHSSLVQLTASSHAPMESFWGSMQVELLDRQGWRTHLERAVAIADYIEHLTTTRPGATAPSATSRRTSTNNYTHPKPTPNCHKTWSTKWGQPQSARSKGFEPPTF